MAEDLRGAGSPEAGAVRRRVVLVTGASGAGRSTAINALEDLGFEAIDNLPMSLIPAALQEAGLTRPIALGVDIRTRGFDARSLIDALAELAREPGADARMLYLDCAPDTLARRYSETRRRHPLAPTEDPLAGIEREIALMLPLRDAADILIDTTHLSPHDLKAEIARVFEAGADGGLSVSLQSFSYKRGLPVGVDMVFDCRFLRNPHWEPELRRADGRAEAVAAFVSGDARYAAFMSKVEDLLTLLLPACVEEGKAHFSVAFGCTGGQHRSVAVAEALAKSLARCGWRVSIRHREMERPAAAMAEKA